MIMRRKNFVVIAITFSIMLTACIETNTGVEDDAKGSSDIVPTLSSAKTEEKQLTSSDNENSSKKYIDDELEAIFAKRENLLTSSEVREWRAELNAYLDKYDEEILTNDSEILSEPITITAEYYSGEFRTSHKGNQNDNISVILEFTAELEKMVYRRGESVTIHAKAENIGDSFMYIPSYGTPTAWLKHTDYVNGENHSKGYATYEIEREQFPIPESIPEETLLETGGTLEDTVVINLPENAVIGMYDILLYSHGYTTIIKDAIEIIE